MKNFLLALAVAIGLPVAAQTSKSLERKLTPSTQLAIAERDGLVTLPETPEVRAQWQLLAPGRQVRPIAEPMMRHGRQMISCIIYVRDGNDTSGIEALGAHVGSRFRHMVTAEVPLTALEKVAALEEVTKVEVATPVDPCTDLSRTACNVDDILTYSSDAQAAGLLQAYRGTGVVAAVIDMGIQFNHSAFKSNNTTRIGYAYVNSQNGGTMQEYTTASAISQLTYDYASSLHGTHTFSILGGSDYTSGSSTYGGMAPDATLAVAGLGSNCYTNAYIVESMQKIKAYAQSVNKPCVISISIASHENAHDGTSAVSQAITEVADEGCIVVIATGNYAGRALSSRISSGYCSGGGLYAGGTATNSTPWMAVLHDYSSSSSTNKDVDNIVKTGRIYAYARTPNVPISVQLHVLSVSSGSVLWSSSAYTSGTNTITSVGSGSTTYYTISDSNLAGNTGITVKIDQDATSGKYYAIVYLSTLATKSAGSYALALSIKPTGSTSTVIDAWNSYSSGNAHFGTLTKTPSGYNVCAGTDDGSASEYSCVEKAISVGNYVTRQSVTANGTTHTYNNGVGEIAYTSCWKTASSGPTTVVQPTVCAPGTYIIAAINKNYSKYTSYKTAGTTSDPYGYSNGTSMSTPHVAGIIALWLQADPTLTPARVKEIIAATAMSDSYTTAKPDPFGCGKIDALAGLQYILASNATPTIEASPTSVSFSDVIVGSSATQDVTVSGTDLTGNITVSVSGSMFSANKTSIAQSNGSVSTTVTITYAPTTIGQHTGTLTLSSADAEDVVVNLSGTAQALTPTLGASQTALSLSTPVGVSTQQTLTVTGANLTGNVTATASGTGFSVSPTTFTAAQAMAGQTVTVTYAPTEAGQHTGTLTLSSADAEDVVVSLSGTAFVPIPTLELDKTALNFTARLNDQKSDAVGVTASYLTGIVTATLTDEHGVFGVSPASMTAAEAMAGGSFNVTFLSEEEGTFTGTLTVATDGVTAQTVALTATANDSGTASDAYLDVHKYSTIDEVGWTTSMIDVFYKYTAYTSNGIGWLTMPVYSAEADKLSGGLKAQNWLAISGTTRLGATWTNSPTYTSPYMGSSTYFTSATAYAYGRSNTTNTTEQYASFYVTNVTEVKVNGKNNSGASSQYPSSLKVYECTDNGDGTLTVSSTATGSSTYSTANSNFDLSVTGLDADKIYVVRCSTYRGYFYEIAFQTPLVAYDIDNNQVLNWGDVEALVNILTGHDHDDPTYNYNYDAADVNGDGHIGLGDITALVSRLKNR